MIKEAYFNTPKKIRIFAIVLIALLVIIFVVLFFFIKTREIPNDFETARQNASSVATDIVNSSNESAVQINKISDLSNNGQYEEALNLILSEMQRNREVRQKAIILSSDLGTMAQNIANISPESSARQALEAVSTETTLISQLISYNDYLDQLLDILRAKMIGQDKDSHDKIIALIKSANDEANAINQTNTKFNQLLNQFDGK